MVTDYKEYCEIDNVEIYIKKIREIYNEWLASYNQLSVFFRGQTDDFDLLPSVLREKDNRQYNERLIVTYFNSLYKNYSTERFTKKPELFSYMQHYGIPTRLLDWTENSLMALFFAIDISEIDSNKNPTVWVLNPSGLNAIFIEEMNGILDSTSPHILARFDMIGYINKDKIIDQFFNIHPQYNYYKDYLETPLCFYPESSGNNRIIVQKGIFTIHGTKNISINALMKIRNREKYLKKLIIDKNKIKIIRNDLRVMGITPRSVYPDLEGLNAEIRELCLLKKEKID